MKTSTKPKTPKLTIEIEPGPHTGPSGVRFLLVLEPERRTVTVDRLIGAGTPFLVHNHRARAFTLPTAFLGSDVIAAVERLRGTFETVIKSYQGCAWNGRNHVGSWSDEPEAEGARLAISERLGALRGYMEGGELAEWYAAALTRSDLAAEYPAAVAGDLKGLKAALAAELDAHDDYPRANDEAIEQTAEWMIERVGPASEYAAAEAE